MYKIESREISNRKYLSKTILAYRERQAKIGTFSGSIACMGGKAASGFLSCLKKINQQPINIIRCLTNSGQSDFMLEDIKITYKQTLPVLHGVISVHGAVSVMTLLHRKLSAGST